MAVVKIAFYLLVGYARKQAGSFANLRRTEIQARIALSQGIEEGSEFFIYIYGRVV